MNRGSRPFRRTQVQGAGDFFDASNTVPVTVRGMRLAAGAAAATAQITDQDGTVLADLTAPANGSDTVNIPVLANRKVALAAITGAGAVAMVYIE